MVILKSCVLFVFNLWEFIRKPDISEREMKCGGYLKNGEINLRGIWYNENFELFSEDDQSKNLQGYSLSSWIY